MIHHSRLLRLMMFTIVLAGCETAPPVGPVEVENALAKAPTEIDIDGRTLTLEAHPWRNFQPIVPAGGPPLQVLVRVRTTDRSPFPAAISAEQVTVLYEGQAWTAPLGEHGRWERHELQAIARGGPLWPTSVKVEVIVHLRDAEGGVYWLRDPDSVIERAD